MENGNYISSITSKYGDIDRVKNDAKTIQEILNRQGFSLLIDCIASRCGEKSIEWNLNEKDISNLIKSLVSELKESLQERL